MSTSKRVGFCTKCGHPSDWNTPYIDPKYNLWCNTCASNDRTDVVFRAVEQQLNEQGEVVQTGGLALNGITLNPDKNCWVEGGSRAVPLTEDELKMPHGDLIRLINQEFNVNHITRCTSCTIKMTQDEIGGYPLFAGCVCAPCWAKHLDFMETERRQGHVCRMCHQPYSNCCC